MQHDENRGDRVQESCVGEVVIPCEAENTLCHHRRESQLDTPKSGMIKISAAFEVLLWFWPLARGCGAGRLEGIRRQMDYGSAIKPAPVTNRAARATPDSWRRISCAAHQ